MIDRSNEHDVALYAAYLALAKRYRPDLGREPGDGADAHFRKIEEAYETLRDALRRLAYEPQREDQRFVVSEDAASHPDKADERADPQGQHPRQAPAFEPGNPRVSPTALGEGERKGKVEQLIIKIFLVAAACGALILDSDRASGE
jgi:curved DNA-binding protein CbpA